jgi:hypothetical protein
MKVGNWPAGITKYMTAAMMQIIARMYAMALIEPSPLWNNPFSMSVKITRRSCAVRC